MRRQLILILVVVLVCGATAQGHDYTIDQYWERPQSPYSWDSMSIRNGQPMGQEFTPTANIIAGVALSIDYFDFSPCGDTTFAVKIREDTIAGNIVASTTLALDNIYESQANPSDEWRFFDFGQLVPIIAGNRYVIDLSIPIGSGYWSWNSWEDSDNIGVPGRMIWNGYYYNPGGGTDEYAFGFRTYTPEPATLLLLGLGCLLLRRRKSA